MDCPWYIRNADLHRDLGIDLVKKVAQSLASAHALRLHNHVNEEVSNLLLSSEGVRRLRRVRPSIIID